MKKALRGRDEGARRQETGKKKRSRREVGRGEVLSRGWQINERAPRRGGVENREEKRDREKVTKVHFIEFWVAVLLAQERTLQVNKFPSFLRAKPAGSLAPPSTPSSFIARYGDPTLV